GDHAILGAGLEQLVVAGLAVRQHALTVLVGRAGRPALRVGDGVLRLGRQRRQRDRLEARGVTAFGHGFRVGRSAAVAGLDQGEALVVVGGVEVLTAATGDDAPSATVVETGRLDGVLVVVALLAVGQDPFPV